MKVGREGENQACKYLEDRGHTILERNWRSGHLEIDIISLADDGLHFTEVKTRVAPLTARPEDNVGYVKQQRIIRAAKAYLNVFRKKNIFSDFEIYFDVLSVIFEGENSSILYMPQAYLPLYV